LRILIEKGDAYVVLRGGTGTLVELSLVWELMNKNFTPRKPIIAVNFWTPIVQTISKQLLNEGSIDGAGLVKIIDTVDEIVEHIKNAFAIENKR
jgi:predicted Rossmann-fold nucleotide-binding protein